MKTIIANSQNKSEIITSLKTQLKIPKLAYKITTSCIKVTIDKRFYHVNLKKDSAQNYIAISGTKDKEDYKHFSKIAKDNKFKVQPEKSSGKISVINVINTQDIAKVITTFHGAEVRKA